MKTSHDEFYVQIITDKYAGNFEREMCAFITGQYGDCGVGEEEAQLVPSQIQSLFEGAIDHKSDESGCARPCEVDYGEHNAFKIFFLKTPTQQMMDIICERAERFCMSRQSAELREILGLPSVKSCPTVIKAITIFHQKTIITTVMVLAESE
jgi:hypothetical protein